MRSEQPHSSPNEGQKRSPKDSSIGPRFWDYGCTVPNCQEGRQSTEFGAILI